MTEEIKKAIEEITRVDEPYGVLRIALELCLEQRDSLFIMLERQGVEIAELRQDYNDQLEKLLKAGG